ncbi:MAG: hypothetical protein CM15mP53_04210 [Ectothiorhodospiraceae bacterium]|nr:MAG: hypothetical protein CM15mP53_04210 [Ectothiorhodospiraceae bacterium]
MIKSEEKKEQAIVDNRLQGQNQKIYQSYYGVVRSMLDSNKKYLSYLFKGDKRGHQILEFTILKMVMS